MKSKFGFTHFAKISGSLQGCSSSLPGIPLVSVLTEALHCRTPLSPACLLSLFLNVQRVHAGASNWGSCRLSRGP